MKYTVNNFNKIISFHGKRPSEIRQLGRYPKLIITFREMPVHLCMFNNRNIFIVHPKDIKVHRFKVIGHPFWRFAENRYCALKISPIFIKFSPNVSQCMQNMIKLKN
jgi:hypothetical protein